MPSISAPHLPPRPASFFATSPRAYRVLFVLAAALLGLVAGIAGAIIAVGWIIPRPELALISGPREAPRVADTFIDSNRYNEMRQVTVAFIRPQVFSTSTPLAQRILTPHDFFGFGVAVTADGWFVTSGRAAASPANVLLPDGDIVEIEKKIDDPLTGLIFVKVKTQNIAVASFGRLAAEPIGASIFYPKLGGVVARAALMHTNASFCTTKACNQSRSSEALYTAGLIPSDAEMLPGTPVFSGKGEIIGIGQNNAGDEEAVVLPVASIASILDELLREGEIRRPFFGVNFIDAARTPVAGLTGALRRGAVIQGFAKSKRLPHPALAAGLKFGDTIVRVEGEPLGAEKTLPEILATYKPGQEIEMVVVRQGKEEGVKVRLGV